MQKLHALQQLQLQHDSVQRCAASSTTDPVCSPPGPLCSDMPYLSITDYGRRQLSDLPVSPPTTSSGACSSASSSTSNSPSSTTDVDYIKDNIRNVEELIKAPLQAHSAIQKIHKGQRISGMDQETEVAEIKLIVYQLLLAPTPSNHVAGLQALLGNAGGPGGMGDSITSPLHNNNNNGHPNGRKRSANFGNGGGPSQPEQPVALRPAIGNCTLSNGGSSFLPQWSTTTPWTLFNSLRNTSPTLPGAAPTTETASAQDGQKPLWSSPSSVESGHKPESNAGDSNIDPVGMESDGSPTSSTCTQSPADALAFAAAAIQNSTMPLPNGVHERKPRKQISDDYVKLIRQQHELSGKNISDIQIPDVQEATTQLCKKLAEKRVFGPRLMAQTTVAGPNHSTYNNLPDEGIIYIQHVCRTVLKDKLKSEEEFWDVFREAMRKLAARCRRVRHAKKTKSMKENGVTPLLENQTQNALAMLAGGFSEQWLENVKKNVAKHEDVSPPQSLVSALHQFTQNNGTVVKSESPEEPVSSTSQSDGGIFKGEDIMEWVRNQINQSNSAATSPVLPMQSSMPPALQHVFQGASA
ncbi:lin-14 [Pristionchus pacificus]|uniref:Lin-14 n=1 Tax=Pristionchus pacificus TaxID=54126 RepID=A0A2A6CUP8_PRIPA|nr:lin-14 [Pristionchus pacificus]|eukprot:PDM81820.1 lin-14 [Pristionchus pacificus]